MDIKFTSKDLYFYIIVAFCAGKTRSGYQKIPDDKYNSYYFCVKGTVPSQDYCAVMYCTVVNFIKFSPIRAKNNFCLYMFNKKAPAVKISKINFWKMAKLKIFVLIFRFCKPNSVNLGDSLRRFWIWALFKKKHFWENKLNK